MSQHGYRCSHGISALRCGGEWEWLEVAVEVLERASLATLLLPGIGTADDLRRARDLGVASVRIATHCTDADIARQHIRLARELGMDVAGWCRSGPRTGVEFAVMMNSLHSAAVWPPV